MKINEKQIAMLGIMTTVKFVATADRSGSVNVAPILSLCHYREDLLVFGDFLMVKTRQNLAENEKVSVLVMDEQLNTFKVSGTFQGFVTKGEAFDFMNSSPMVKYNAYTGIRSAGLIRVDSADPILTLSKLRMAAELISGALPVKKMAINRVAGEKFKRIKAFKALSYIEGGRPVAVPVLIARIDGDTMVFRAGRCPSGVLAAMSVITPEPVTYQAKGMLTAEGSLCRLKVEEIYAGGVPIPGRRIS